MHNAGALQGPGETRAPVISVALELIHSQRLCGRTPCETLQKQVVSHGGLVAATSKPP